MLSILCRVGAMVYMLYYKLVVCEFELQSRCYVNFQTHTLGNRMNLPPSYKLNIITAALLQGC